MDKFEPKLNNIRDFFILNADPIIVKKYSRYFKDGYDGFGIDDKKFMTQKDKWLNEWKEEFSLEDYYILGDKLVATGKWEEGSLAIHFMVSKLNEMTSKSFNRIGLWLDNGFRNWAHTDVFSSIVLSHFIISGLVEMEALNDWVKASSEWKRRAIPVTLINALKNDKPVDRMLKIIDPLMPDSSEYVQKGLGWFLREAWKKYPEKAEGFLLKWKDTCGRLIIQYATEKMTKENKLRFKKNKK